MNARALAILILAMVPATHPGVAQEAATYAERYRPQYHFTPAANWMNDPNGMVYFNGEYHLFYQYNPFGDRWGHMSWGHAVSRDLVRWNEMPVALAEEDSIMVFSGSAVVDWNDTSGFGEGGAPPLVAVYTGHHTSGRHQAQHLAYSNDAGRTWTKYEGNPVLDRGLRDFRDPKVFWYEPDEKWVMVVALPTEFKVQFYASEDLKAWTHLSDFGPAGAVGGIWECPDLFALPVDGDAADTRWVLVVNLNPGSIAGGSGGQYFIGRFDGTTFTAEDAAEERGGAGLQAAELLADFEGADYGGWTATGTAFGRGPARGGRDGPRGVANYRGDGLVNSFIEGDAATGTLTSPPFRITRGYLNFLVGGGNHAATRAELLVDGNAVRTARGEGGEILDWTAWDVRELQGRTARLRIVDEHTGGRGHILVDHVELADAPALPSRARARWLDYGADYYAAVSWSGVPETDGDRLMIGWMSNWMYAGVIPTAPWRSAQSLPRRVRLRTLGGAVTLVQQPAQGVELLRRTQRHVGDLPVAEGTHALAAHGVKGKAVELIAEFEVGDAAVVGLKVRTGTGEETRIGYDVAAEQVFVDRTSAGVADFHPGFAARHAGPLKAEDGRVTLRVFVDWSSVEVFAGAGQTVITEQVFPDPESDGVAVFAEGGGARLVSLHAWELAPAWDAAAAR